MNLKLNKISFIGLGYVGLPLAVSFAENGIEILGFDINPDKINAYKSGIDVTGEVGNKRLSEAAIFFTTDEKMLQSSKFHIVAVPTPVGKNNVPNLNPVENACSLLGRNLKKGAFVVFESTVYPGVTEDICIPILEKESGLKCGLDFKVGYSPERINPGDKVNTVENIIKIVSGIDKESLDYIASVYEIVIKPGVHRAPSIKVAEAAKVIENAQRDVNIAFMNELSIIFDKMGIDTKEVLEAAGTKWNFLKFSPGLVGGHCIGVDPYYLTYRSEELGYISQLILSGRRINDSMSKFVAEKTLKSLIESGSKIKGAKVLVLGLTFKENVPDLRNSKVVEMMAELKGYGINVEVVDPVASKEDAMRTYSINLQNLHDVRDVDAIILAVSHKEFLSLSIEEIKKLYSKEYQNPVLLDLKGMLDKNEAKKSFNYWRM